MFRRNGIDAMGERWADQIGIQQGNNTANTGDTKPYGDVFGPIGHQQADNFAFAEPLIERPARILIDPPRELPIGQALAV